MNDMSHDGWFELVSAATDGQLATHERALLDDHLTQCASCTSLLQRFEDDRRRQRLAESRPVESVLASVLQARDDDLHTRRQVRATLLRRTTLAAVGVAAAVFGCASLVAMDEPPTGNEMATTVKIDARQRTFDTPDIEVVAGTTVEWRNAGQTTHHLVRRLGGVTVTEDLPPGHTEAATFAEPGTYEYFCTIHEDMAGTIRVDT